MKKEIINLNFLLEINKKIPNKTELVNILLDLLQIEKEAIYRRLRGDVPFSFKEVIVMADRFGISIDELAGIQHDKRMPFNLQITEYETPTDVDFYMWNNYCDILELFGKQSNFSIYETWTTLPFPLCYRYPAITQFYIFKWIFHVKNYAPIKPYEQIKINRNQRKLGLKNLKLYSQASDIQVIFADNMFTNLVKDVTFFRNIRLISLESLRSIRKDLIILLNELEKIAVNGYYQNENQKVAIYVSEAGLDSDYTLMNASGNYISMIRMLYLNAATTTEESSYEHIEKWFTASKRVASNISVSGEKERIRYFKEQREIIHALESIK